MLCQGHLYNAVHNSKLCARIKLRSKLFFSYHSFIQMCTCVQRSNILQQGVALTGRNSTGPLWSVGRPTAHAPGGLLVGTVTDDDR